MGILVRALVAGLGLLLVTVMLIDWNSLVWTGSSRATNDAQLRGEPTMIQARVSGLVVEEAVDDNAPVRRGQLLFRMEDDYAHARFDAALAQAAQAAASVRTARAQAASAGAQIDSARRNAVASDAQLRFAQLDADRWNRLVGGPGDLLRARQQANASLGQQQSNAQGDRDRIRTAQARQDSLKADVARAGADLRAAEHAVTLARIDLDRTRVVAPEDGRVTERVVHVGQFVAPGRRLIDFVPLPGTWAVAWYREEQVAGMAVGQPVEIHVDAYPELRLAGCVAAFGPDTQSWSRVVPPDRATGNFTKTVQRLPVKITYVTPVAYTGRLIPGLSIETRVLLHGVPCTPPPAEPQAPIPPQAGGAG